MAKVLVADDSIAVRKVAERHLTEAGLEVTLAANGEEAVALLANDRPDVIICDVIMPDKSGYDVCSFTRAQASLSGTPFLLISGIVNDDVTRQAQSCGADGVLKKPFQGVSLRDQVFELLAKGQGAPPAPTPSAPEPPSAAEKVAVSQPVQDQSLELQKAASEIQELQAALAKEQQEIAQLRQQVAEASTLQDRIQELELALTAERDAAAQLVEKLSDAEREAERAKELEGSLTVERNQAAEATENLAQAEQAAERVGELEDLLAKECEQTAQLSQQLADTESALAQAKAKHDELSQKLSKITELCGS